MIVSLHTIGVMKVPGVTQENDSDAADDSEMHDWAEGLPGEVQSHRTYTSSISDKPEAVLPRKDWVSAQIPDEPKQQLAASIETLRLSPIVVVSDPQTVQQHRTFAHISADRNNIAADHNKTRRQLNNERSEWFDPLFSRVPASFPNFSSTDPTPMKPRRTLCDPTTASMREVS